MKTAKTFKNFLLSEKEVRALLDSVKYDIQENGETKIKKFLQGMFETALPF